MMTIARMIIDAMRTGLFIASANFGFHQRTSIPRMTGPSTITNTSTVFENSRPSPTRRA